MRPFASRVGVQFVTTVSSELDVPRFVELAGHAAANGFDRVWLSDFMGRRDALTVLTAIAQEVPIGVGTAVIVPYLYHPIKLADRIASLTELTPEREVTVGLGRGDPFLVGHFMEQPAPYRMLAETARFCRSLLEGESVSSGEYDLLASYFNLEPDAQPSMTFTPPSPVGFYLGGHGPTAMRTAGRAMDGLLLGAPFLPLYRAGRIEPLLETASEAAGTADRPGPLRNVAEINVSVADDRAAARTFPRPFIAHMMSGPLRELLTDAEFEDLGINPADVDRIRTALDGGATVEAAGAEVTSEMVDATFVAGTPEEVAPQIEEIAAEIERLGFDRVLLAKLGPDLERALELLGESLDL